LELTLVNQLDEQDDSGSSVPATNNPSRASSVGPKSERSRSRMKSAGSVSFADDAYVPETEFDDENAAMDG
jgi:hypothetical protein